MARVNWGELENSASQKMEAGKYYTREELSEILTEDEIKAIDRDLIFGRQSKFNGIVSAKMIDGKMVVTQKYKIKAVS